MTEQSQPNKTTRAPVLLSVLALSVWIAVAAFLLKWVRAWAAGRLEPGVGTTWVALYGLFAVAVVALAAGIFLTIRAWQGKSTVSWQVLSILLGLFSLWATCGH
jgi:hypothetical protein